MKKNLILGLATCLALGGCFDVEQSLSLRRDLSGTAGFRMTVDLEPMIVFMASMQRSMAGRKGDPTPEEIDAVRQKFLATQKIEDREKKQQELAAQREQLAQGLPPGIELQAAGVDNRGTKMSTQLQFAFDDVAKLAQIRLPEKAGQDQPGANPYADPFSTLKIVDEGPTLLLTLGSVDPAARMREQAGMPEKDAADPEMTKAFEAAFKSMRFAFRLETEFDVVETNATRRDGRSLYWEARAAEPNAELPATLMVRLRK